MHKTKRVTLHRIGIFVEEGEVEVEGEGEQEEEFYKLRHEAL